MKEQNRPFLGHEFKKSLGQNFLRDKNLLKSIVRDGGVTEADVVVEVGAGAGTLTQEITTASKAVVSFEVDKSLEPTLRELEREHKNLKVVFKDALKTENDEIFNLLLDFAGEGLESYKVVANIPYYITTPLIFKFLKDDRVSSITVMVQKEVAERIVSTNTEGEYGGISVLVHFYGTPEIKRIVKRDMFYPAPKVDSAVLNIEKRERVDRELAERLANVVKASFKTRRKMLINNLSNGLNVDKEKLLKIFGELGILPTARAEDLSPADFINLTQKLD